MDRKLKINSDYHVLDGSVKTIIFTEINDNVRYKEGIDYEVIDNSTYSYYFYIDALETDDINYGARITYPL